MVGNSEFRTVSLMHSYYSLHRLSQIHAEQLWMEGGWGGHLKLQQLLFLSTCALKQPQRHLHHTARAPTTQFESRAHENV